jgi:type I restriction enzyme S subunit
VIYALDPYPTYKDSDLPWLCDVPNDWDIRRGKAIFQCIDQRSATGKEELLTVSSSQGVIPRRSANVTMFKAESYKGYKLCWPGDLVINSLWAWGGGLGVSNHHGIISSAYGVYRLKKMYSAYAKYIHELVRSAPFHWELQVRSRGIWISRLQLTDERFLDAPFPLPPPEDCAAIVQFLDHADRRIRRYIKAKQKLIGFLEEQKQAIIHRAVTRGLDPNVRLKPSGIEWLGDVPEHWEVVALRYRYSQVLGKMLDSKHITGVHSLQYLRNTDVQWDRINIEDLPRMDIRPSEYARYTVRRGDLLVCEGGEVGRCAIWESEQGLYGFQKALHRLRPVSAERDLPRFQYYLLRVATNRGAFIEGRESTISHLTGERLRGHRFPYPPVDEQTNIVSHLDSETDRMNIPIASIKHEISLLREYRTRLVSDVVTGKVDVREAAAGLPDEAGVDDAEIDETADDDLPVESEASENDHE